MASGLPNYPIYFDGTNLASLDGISIYNYTMNDLPKRDMTINKIATRDYSLLSRAEFVTKEIKIWVNINKPTRAEVEQAYANLKALLIGTSKQITVPQFGSNINYTSTLYNIDETWEHIDLDLVLIFIATDPIGIDNTLTNLITTAAFTDQSHDVVGNVAGSYYASPLIVATISALTGGTNQSVTLKNTATGQGIVVTRTWTAGDVFSVDSLNRTVTVNGAQVDYQGAFPLFKPGAAIVGYVDSLTTRSVSLAATYYKKYI